MEASDRADTLDQAAAADALNEVVDVRGLPMPPDVLIEDGENMRGARWSAVLPHWNSFVQMLGEHGSGYDSLLRLQIRLKRRLQTMEREMDQASERLREAESRFHALAAEERRYGDGAVVRDSLGDLSTHEDGRASWVWERAGSGSAFEDVEGDNILIKDYFLVLPTKEDTGRSNGGASLVSALSTWAEALAVAYETIEARTEPLARHTDTLLVTEFRLNVLDQVLLEFEVLGHVDSLAPNPDSASGQASTSAVDPTASGDSSLLNSATEREFKLGVSEARIIEAICELTPEGQHGYSSRSALFHDIERRRLIRVGHPRTLQRWATKAGLYRKGEGGRLVEEEEQAEIDYLVQRAHAQIDVARRTLG